MQIYQRPVLFVNFSKVKFLNDDFLDLSRTLQRVSDVFSILEAEYLKLGLDFNSSMSEIVLFNWVQLVGYLAYLDLPLGSSIRHTRYLLVEDLTRCISASYASIMSCKFRFNLHLLASLFNAIDLPHILYISPFWKLLTITDQIKIRSIFFRFAKYLLHLPPWQSNSKIVLQFNIADPNIAVARVIAKHNKKVNVTAHEWYSVLF